MLTSTDIRSAFASPPVPLPVTLGYRLRLLSVIAGLSTLVGLYLALIAIVIGVAWYWLEFGIVFAVSGFTILLWLAPPIAASRPAESAIHLGGGFLIFQPLCIASG